MSWPRIPSPCRYASRIRSCHLASQRTARLPVRLRQQLWLLLSAALWACSRGGRPPRTSEVRGMPEDVTAYAKVITGPTRAVDSVIRVYCTRLATSFAGIDSTSHIDAYEEIRAAEDRLIKRNCRPAKDDPLCGLPEMAVFDVTVDMARGKQVNDAPAAVRAQALQIRRQAIELQAKLEETARDGARKKTNAALGAAADSLRVALLSLQPRAVTLSRNGSFVVAIRDTSQTAALVIDRPHTADVAVLRYSPDGYVLAYDSATFHVKAQCATANPKEH